MYAEVNYIIIGSDSECLGRTIFIQENEFESVVCKMTVILSGTERVNWFYECALPGQNEETGDGPFW